LKRGRTPSVSIHGARALRSFVAMRDIVQAGLNSPDPGELYQFALARVSPLVEATFASVYLMDGASEMMRLVGAYNWPERFRPRLSEVRVRVASGPSGQAAAEQRVVRVDDIQAAGELSDWHEIASELGFTAIVALPLVANSNVLGVLTFYFAQGVRLGDDAIEFMQVAADQLAAYAEKTQLEEALRRVHARLVETEAERDRLAAERSTAKEEEPGEH
jgi:GAF domain-containing protein